MGVGGGEEGEEGQTVSVRVWVQVPQLHRVVPSMSFPKKPHAVLHVYRRFSQTHPPVDKRGCSDSYQNSIHH